MRNHFQSNDDEREHDLICKDLSEDNMQYSKAHEDGWFYPDEDPGDDIVEEPEE